MFDKGGGRHTAHEEAPPRPLSLSTSFRYILTSKVLEYLEESTRLGDGRNSIGLVNGPIKLSNHGSPFPCPLGLSALTFTRRLAGRH